MAKKEKLSLEELLEQALVKEKDRPYNIPGNWVWTSLDSIAEIITGGTPTKAKPEYYGEEFPFIKPADLGQGRHVRYASEYLSKIGKRVSRIVPAGSISICCIGTIGKTGYLECEATTNQQINTVVPRINELYMYYYCLSDGFQSSLIELSSATTISIVNKGKVLTVAVPLPSLLEQQRIVTLIESLFEKLDRAKELAKNALDSFENRKSAILHKAFTGELTRKWREKNRVDFERDWSKKKFCEIASVKSNLVDPMNFKTLPHIAPDSIEKRTGRLIGYRTIEQDGVTSAKHKFYAGQILYSKIRPYLSKVIIADVEGLCSADMYPIETKLETKYLWYYMLDDDFVMAASSAGSRSVLPKINQKELGELMIVCPPNHEQQEIVRILDHLLEKEQKAKKLCNVIDKIDHIKKIVLAKAFRGELGTNNPAEESALELLKEVLQEKAK